MAYNLTKDDTSALTKVINEHIKLKGVHLDNGAIPLPDYVIKAAAVVRHLESELVSKPIIATRPRLLTPASPAKAEVEAKLALEACKASLVDAEQQIAELNDRIKHLLAAPKINLDADAVRRQTLSSAAARLRKKSVDICETSVVASFRGRVQESADLRAKAETYSEAAKLLLSPREETDNDQ